MRLLLITSDLFNSNPLSLGWSFNKTIPPSTPATSPHSVNTTPGSGQSGSQSRVWPDSRAPRRPWCRQWHSGGRGRRGLAHRFSRSQSAGFGLRGRRGIGWLGTGWPKRPGRSRCTGCQSRSGWAVQRRRQYYRSRQYGPWSGPVQCPGNDPRHTANRAHSCRRHKWAGACRAGH